MPVFQTFLFLNLNMQRKESGARTKWIHKNYILRLKKYMWFSELEYFRAIAKYGNMSQAAAELHVSQPGLSRSLTRLESEIGVPLFERRKGLITLNEYGKEFLDYVNEALDTLNAGAESIQREYYDNQNILSVAGTVEQYVPDQLRIFSPLHPEITIHHFYLSASEMENRLLSQNLDIVISCNPFSNKRIAYEIFSTCPFVLICSPKHFLAEKKMVCFHETRDCSFICDRPHLDRKVLNEICSKYGFMPRITHEIDSFYYLIKLIEDNAGIALVPLAYYVKIINSSAKEDLIAIPLEPGFPPASIGAAYLKERPLSPAAETFLDFLKESAAIERSILQEHLNDHRSL